jgi:gliding motility-associated-like protein
MKKTVYISLFILLYGTSHAQLLYLQDTYKGGVSYDGRSYYGFEYLLADTIIFKNAIASGSTIRKAYLISERLNSFVVGAVSIENPINLIFNNNKLVIDSNDIVSNKYYCSTSTPSGILSIVVKDVTSFIASSNNKLIIPCQSCGIQNGQTLYDGFYLVILYDNNSMQTVNTALFLNNQTYSTNMQHTFNGLSPINTAKDVGLSITNNDAPSSANYQCTYELNTNSNTYTLGTIYSNTDEGMHTLPGSFYYQNNSLFGLVDDVNSAFIDSTDALCNIKTYLPNNTTTFSLTSNGNVDGGCDDERLIYILAYSTPCPALATGIDSTRQYAVCTGQGVQISASAGYSNYSWVPATGLSNSAVAAPIATPPTGANKYICYVADAQGCMHTEYFTVNSYATPIISASSTPEICGGTKGVAVINAGGTNFGAYTYTYTLNGAVQSSNIFDLPAGVYSYSVANNFGCNQQGIQSFTITEVNNAKAAFTAQPDTGCAPENIVFTNNSTNTNAQVWYINGDSSNAVSPNYTFTDSGVYTITLLSWYNQRQCSSTVSHTVSLKDCPPPPPVPVDSINITVPNIFTPNADGINDTWQVEIYTRGYTISNFQCNIYDRWGIQVFDSNTSPSGRTGGVAWPGKTSGGESASAGSYFYLIKLTQTNTKGVSENKEFKGYLELIR